MKTRIITLLSAMLLFACEISAQVPQAFNYQAIARDASGNLITNHAVGVKINIHHATASGDISYSEKFITPVPTTNQFGLFTIAIGTGTAITGQFDTISWGGSNYWLEVFIDPTGNASYASMGTSQLLTVPYALYAKTAESLQTAVVKTVSGTSPISSSGGTTPVISMALANSSQSGYLSAADWNTFNSKGSVTTVIGTAPISSSGGAAPVISMAAATSSTNGYLKSTDWNIFNSKGNGTVIGVSGTLPISSSGGTAPVISMTAASTGTDGYLKASDWNTFNSKGSVTTVIGTAPISSSGGAAPVISIAIANSSQSGYLSATDWNIFDAKGNVNSVTGILPIASTGGANPVLSMVAAGSSSDGYLKASDWSAFNAKQPAGFYLVASDINGKEDTSNKVTSVSGASTNLQFPSAKLLYNQLALKVDKVVGKDLSTVHSIGESYGGGIVFYVYDNGQHGLIAATADQSTGMRWYAGTITNTMAIANGVGAGKANTAIIIANQGYGDGATYAARICNEYSVNDANGVTYSDWYLPSKLELSLLYLQKNVVGGFASVNYWCSTELSSNSVWLVSFNNGVADADGKSYALNVRAIRAF